MYNPDKVKKKLIIGLAAFFGFIILMGIIGSSNPQVESEKIETTPAPTIEPSPTVQKSYPPESIVTPEELKASPTPKATVTPNPTVKPTTQGSTSTYTGGDKDCRDFSTHAEAQAFFESQGPGDPHRLDRDGDGIACETLP